ncbi:MAG: serine protease [Kangiellaceae bacterium]|nr:serine protease [Kangiellaceae bacterium]
MPPYIAYALSLPFIFLAYPTQSFSSDAYLKTKTSIGQGFLFERQSECYLATPRHVIQNEKKLSLLLANRREYQATLFHIFESDLAVLKVDDYKACRLKQPEPKVPLSALLKVYQEGVLKTKLADGSTLQTKVTIRGVDEREFLEIQAIKKINLLKQGFSGSVLYIADQPAGILLEVTEDNSGIVFRQDAIWKELATHFQYKHKQTASDNDATLFSTGQLKGRLNTGQSVEHKAEWKQNSPIRFIQSKQTPRHHLELSIAQKNGKVLYQKSIDTAYSYEFTFTPPESDAYLLKLTGKKSSGPYSLIIEQWLTDAELRSEGNIIDTDMLVTGKIAAGAVAEYRFAGQSNSPVKYYLPKQTPRHNYSISILNARKKALLTKSIDSAYDYEFAFTPSATEIHTFRLSGTKDHGPFKLTMTQFALDSELRGSANTLNAGDTVDSKIATGTTAEYIYKGMANAPIEFYLPKQSPRHYYSIAIIDNEEKVHLQKKIDTAHEYNFVFTPPNDGDYNISLTGTKDHGPVKLGISQYAFDSDLRGSANTVSAGETISTKIATGATAEYRYHGQQNSPITLFLPKQKPRHHFRLNITNDVGKVLLSKNIDSAHEYNFAFTPQASGTYKIQMTGTKDHGPLTVKLAQYALDADLRGSANNINPGDTVANKLATGAVAEYFFAGFENSPLKFYIPKQTPRHHYDVTVLDSRGKPLMKKNINTQNDYEFAFTPLTNTNYSIRLEGTKSHGKIKFTLTQWALDSELRGRTNTAENGATLTGNLATGAVAEYQYSAIEDSPIDFYLPKQNPRHYYSASILNQNESILFTKKIDSQYDYELSYSPQNTGILKIRFTGRKGHGQFLAEIN